MSLSALSGQYLTLIDCALCLAKTSHTVVGGLYFAPRGLIKLQTLFFVTGGGCRTQQGEAGGYQAPVLGASLLGLLEVVEDHSRLIKSPWNGGIFCSTVLEVLNFGTT